MIRGGLIFISMTVVSAYLMSLINSYIFGFGLNSWIAVASLAIGFLFSELGDTKNIKKTYEQSWLPLSLYEKIFVSILFFSVFYSLLFVFVDHNSSLITSNPNNLGDLPLHLHFMNFFARGGLLPAKNPIYAGVNLNYPYGFDFFESIIHVLGVSETGTYLLSSFICVILIFAVLLRLGGVFLLGAIFFSGGLVFHFDAVTSFGPQSDLMWKNIFYSVLQTQRGFLYALPLGCYLILVWQRFLDEKIPFLRLHFFWLWSTLAFFHLHTFFILSIWFFITGFKVRHLLWQIFLKNIYLISCCFFIALLILLRSLDQENVQSSLSFMKFWSIIDLRQAMLNFSSLFVIPLFVSYRFIKKRSFYNLAVGWFLTFLCFNLKLAPFVWDQIKVIIWIYILWIFWFYREFRQVRNLSLLFVALFFWSGAIAFVSGFPSLSLRYEIQSGQDREQVKKLFTHLNANQVVYAVDLDHLNPALGLGQSLFLGYPGHIWTHGLDLSVRNKMIEDFWKNPTEAWPHFVKLGVQYILIKKNESEQFFNYNNRLLSGQFDVIGEEGDWMLWSSSSSSSD